MGRATCRLQLQRGERVVRAAEKGALNVTTEATSGDRVQETEIPFVDGIPFPPPVRPVIILSGSDYELGYQYFPAACPDLWNVATLTKGDFLYCTAPLHRDGYSSEQKDALRRYDSTSKTTPRSGSTSSTGWSPGRLTRVSR